MWGNTDPSARPRALASTTHHAQLRVAHNRRRIWAWTPISGCSAKRRTNFERTMKMARLSAFAEINLNKQGFEKLDKDTKARIAWPLRFTPAVGTTLIVIGLILQSPIWLGSLALVALSGALLPDAMIIDLIYNFGVRHLVHAPALPSTPRPRQFSYLLSSVLLSGSAVSFHYGLPVIGLVLGALVVAGGTILATTLWCLGSWCYRMIFRHAARPTGTHADCSPADETGLRSSSLTTTHRTGDKNTS